MSDVWTPERIAQCLLQPTHERPAAIYNALAQGWSVEEISRVTHIHPWFITRFSRIWSAECEMRNAAWSATDGFEDRLFEAKRMGFSDQHIQSLRNSHSQSPLSVPQFRIRPTYKMVDTCAGEFAASTPYFYSCYEQEDEATPLEGSKVIVLGSGPIRIGQGIEFDYSSVHAVQALRAAGIKAIVINNNPETVSTDYHLSDRLYFEPLTLEEVLNVVEHERDGLLGVIAQFGGQTALNLIHPLTQAGVTILGTSPASIAATEDRDQLAKVCELLDIPVPFWSIARSQDELEAFAPQIGFPVLVRPSYVLGGMGMRVIHEQQELRNYLQGLGAGLREHPVLIDQFLQDAIEIDVDGVSDGQEIFTVVMEQLEKAGIHSGDSACVYPPQTLSRDIIEQVEAYTLRLARHLRVIGLINVQYAVQNGKVYLLEVNARASRTVPFASKATGVPLATIATQLIMGVPFSELVIEPSRDGKVSVKAAVLPFNKFPGLIPMLGPEMQSTGEAMGVGFDFETALAKAYLGAGIRATPALTPVPATES